MKEPAFSHMRQTVAEYLHHHFKSSFFRILLSPSGADCNYYANCNFFSATVWS